MFDSQIKVELPNVFKERTAKTLEEYDLTPETAIQLFLMQVDKPNPVFLKEWTGSMLSELMDRYDKGSSQQEIEEPEFPNVSWESELC